MKSFILLLMDGVTPPWSVAYEGEEEEEEEEEERRQLGPLLGADCLLEKYYRLQ